MEVKENSILTHFRVTGNSWRSLFSCLFQHPWPHQIYWKLQNQTGLYWRCGGDPQRGTERKADSYKPHRSTEYSQIQPLVQRHLTDASVLCVLGWNSCNVVNHPCLYWWRLSHNIVVDHLSKINSPLQQLQICSICSGKREGNIKWLLQLMRDWKTVRNKFC